MSEATVDDLQTRLANVRTAIDRFVANDGVSQYGVDDRSGTIDIRELRRMEKDLMRRIQQLSRGRVQYVTPVDC